MWGKLKADRPIAKDEIVGQFIYAYSLITSLFFAWGFAYGLLDSLNKHFQEVFGITKTQSTFMQVSYFGSWAGAFMRRVGYKNGIYAGLTMYSVIFYWPVAVKKSYVGFIICTFFISMGLSTLEVAANTYITILGDPKYGAMRLTFTGPLIASQEFFKGSNATSLTNVQWVYLAVACFGLLLILLFKLARLPEVDEAALSDTLTNQADVAPLHKQYHLIFGFWAQFSYVGAQVAVATFCTNFFADTPSINFSPSKASLWYSYCQMVFALGRFIGALLLRYVDPAHALTFYLLACALFSLGVILGSGNAAVVSIFFVFFFESICWVKFFFALAISRLGHLTKIGGSFVVSGVGGGALYAPLQGVLSDKRSTQIGYWVAFAGYINALAYGVGMCIDKERRKRIDSKTGRRIDDVPQPTYVEDGSEKSGIEKL
ncbi:major facilitator superfamily domain-containing protein [Gautieria morchelliformis]|nr:major facilitator superfamily domain-containing protein [Gautieria morchelliformis]